jgi:hypothetical protein
MAGGLLGVPPTFGSVADSALPTGECQHAGKAWKQVHRPAVRTHFAGNLKREFHVGERLFKISRGNSANHSITFIADYRGLFPANDAIQTAATVPIANAEYGRVVSMASFKPQSVTRRAINLVVLHGQ